jgi:hypothetical protein
MIRRIVVLLAALALLPSLAGAATYYVRKSGNDTTGDGSTGAPWLTVYKANGSIGAGGHTVNIGPGDYEEVGVAGYAFWNTNFASPVTFQAEDPANRPRIMNSTLASTGHICSGNKYRWKNLILTGKTGLGATTLFRFNSANNQDNSFENVDFVAVSNTTTILLGNFAAAMGSLAFTNVVFDIGAADPTALAAAFDVTGVTGGVTTLTATGIRSNAPRFNLQNVRGGTLANSTFSTTHGLALAIGADADTGLATTITATGLTVSSSSTGTHAMLIGAGAVNVSVTGLSIPTAGDYGLVFKSTAAGSANVVSNAVIRGGPGGTAAALYFKGAQGGTVQDSTLIAPAQRAILAQANDALVKPAGNIVRRIRVSVFGSANVFNWATASENGGNVFDANIYSLCGSGNFGLVLADGDVLNYTELRAAWAGYGGGSNDATSRVARTLSYSLGSSSIAYSSPADCPDMRVGN